MSPNDPAGVKHLTDLVHEELIPWETLHVEQDYDRWLQNIVGIAHYAGLGDHIDETSTGPLFPRIRECLVWKLQNVKACIFILECMSLEIKEPTERLLINSDSSSGHRIKSYWEVEARDVLAMAKHVWWSLQPDNELGAVRLEHS
ncbi:hypothetical protein GMORB2_6505 [Geosmithia morbida]|uniref:Uncharacterized protein n=1 Tax=Geosmithia morbida TaxID=1094350 RepID=A0A9P5D1P0_9HYPO|nr:uncharacterized protein GMORB2_6505 [Geosmithia morbida]KAF4122957.1 hypothetical protein GMORB2_6505 [Geosmithia morbida]